MKSYFIGKGIGGSCLHMIHYFDGQHLREIEVMTFNGKIDWTETKITGVLEPGINYRSAKRRLASLEKRCTSRIG